MRPLRSVCVVALVALAGCTMRNAAPEPAPVEAAPATAVLAEADPARKGGCATAIAGTRAIVDSDVATGNIDPPVGQRFAADLDEADTVCAAGRGREALRLLAAAKVRYGYR